MAQIDIKLPQFHEAQQLIANAESRFKVIACGRRFGKTVMAIRKITEAAIADPGPYAYMTPTYKMLMEAWREFKHRLNPIIQDKNETERRLELINGASIEFWSLENIDGPRGRKYKGIVIDEAAKVRQLQTAWEMVLRPTLADHKGWAWFMSTPRGRDYFYTLWARGGTNSWRSWKAPTRANPFIDPEEIDDAQRELPARIFQQEYEAEFINDDSGVFRGVYAASCLPIEDMLHERAHPSDIYVMGVDWGRVNDFTVIVVMNAITGEQVFIDRFNQVSWEIQSQRVITAFNRFSPQVCLVENNSVGSVLLENLSKEIPVEPFQTTHQSKNMIIDSLALAIEKQEIKLLDHDRQVSELIAYESRKTTAGNLVYSAPPGGHDDFVMALAIAYQGVTRRIYNRTTMSQGYVKW